MDEPAWLPVILGSIGKQTYRNFSVVVCVNQPDAWWNDPGLSPACSNNAGSISLLGRIGDFPVEVIDRSSPGLGWKGKKHGAGWARKIVMDHISSIAQPDDIILSLDADTLFSENYFESVASTLSDYPQSTALFVPYYHPLPEDHKAARAILRYEIYMRYYLLNLLRIRSPYSFTALGSAMAIPVWAYDKVGGMTPKLSGEDFYFLQKLRKAGNLASWNGEKVFPAARFSSRVFFGTGPAMIRGATGDWESYPIYPYRLFDEIAESCNLFSELFIRTVETTVTGFLRKQSNEEDPFASMRKNSRETNQFVRACHEKFDGLRILQYLKQRHKTDKEAGKADSDEENLVDWLETFFPASGMRNIYEHKFSFTETSLGELDQVRDFLANEEERIRKKNPLI